MIILSKTINFFREITKIPRKSGYEEKIVKFLIDFAKMRNLYWEIDKFNNVLIKKKTAKKKLVILQCHTDMVCVSDNKNFDFFNDSIEIIKKNGHLFANKTTLGADNGIGIALILNILDSDIPCNIEAIFTSSEETDMNGAKHLDMSKIKGKYMINLDGFDENLIVNGACSYYEISIKKPKEIIKETNNKIYKIALNGLPGGHSGYDVDKNKGNAIILLAQFLKNLDIKLIEFKGGSKTNIFPTEAYAIISSNTLDIFTKKDEFLKINQQYYPNLKITIKKSTKKNTTFKNSKDYLNFLSNFPHDGIYYQKNSVVTSINLGIIDNYNINVSIRSLNEKKAKKILQKLSNYCKKFGFILNILDYHPPFHSSLNSKLIKALIKSSPYNTLPQVKTLHITLEVGYFQEKIPNLEIAVISPNIKNAHSTSENIDIKSIAMVDKWLENFLNDF